MPLHEGQKRFLRDGNQKINILVPANRWGKSVTIAIKHIHACFYKIGIGRGNADAWAKAYYATANLAPHYDMAKPVFDAVRQIMTSSFRISNPDGSVRTNNCLIGWMLDEGHIRNTPPLLIPFTNRSEIMFRSTGEDKGDSIQGKNFGYISYDEGGRSDHLEYELTSNILPRLADLNGHLDIVSTPDQKSPSLLYHYDLFKKGGGEGNVPQPGYYAQEGDAGENIFLPADYVRQTEELYAGDPIVDQVLRGKFVWAGDSIFPAEDIMAAIEPELDMGIGYEPGHNYVIGVDTAMGEDEMVFTVLDVTDPTEMRMVRQVACKGNSKSPDIHLDDFIGLIETYRREQNVKLIVETWNGESGMFCLNLPYDLQAITTTYGSWTFPGRPKTIAGKNPRAVKKADMILSLRKALAQRKLKIPNESTLRTQLSIYREADEKIPTDRLISLALACWLATDGQPRVTELKYQPVNW